MGWTSDATAGLAAHLAAAGVGAWNPAGVYTADQTAIVVGVTPTAPDRCVTITPYTVADATAGSDTVQGFQVRCRAGRGNPVDVYDLADAVHEALHGATDLTLGQARVALIYRASHTQLGVDENGRHQTVSNFYATTGHATDHVTD